MQHLYIYHGAFPLKSGRDKGGGEREQNALKEAAVGRDGDGSLASLGFDFFLSLAMGFG